MKDTSMKAQLCLFNMEKLFSKRGQLNFLSEQGKPENGEKLPAKQSLVLESPQLWGTTKRISASSKKHVTLALRNEPEKLKTKTE